MNIVTFRFREFKDTAPTLVDVEDRYVEDKQGIAGPPTGGSLFQRSKTLRIFELMNRLGDPASSAELAALRARIALIVRSATAEDFVPFVCRHASSAGWRFQPLQVDRPLLSCSSVEQDEGKDPGQDSKQRAENREPERNIDGRRFNHKLVCR
jgi:hypothetical protein